MQITFPARARLHCNQCMSSYVKVTKADTVLKAKPIGVKQLTVSQRKLKRGNAATRRKLVKEFDMLKRKQGKGNPKVVKKGKLNLRKVIRRPASQTASDVTTDTQIEDEIEPTGPGF